MSHSSAFADEYDSDYSTLIIIIQLLYVYRYEKRSWGDRKIEREYSIYIEKYRGEEQEGEAYKYRDSAEMNSVTT